MKKIVLITGLLISSNIAFADGQSHDHDMSKMEQSNSEMSQQQMKKQDSENKGVTHKHKGKNSPIETKEDHNMDDMKMDDAEKMHDHMKMK
ncbi:MAG: hypothetical protein COA63_002420 [Methylophaga sp.]|nr:hypothetical protein [Methylophaga sp.]